MFNHYSPYRIVDTKQDVIKSWRIVEDQRFNDLTNKTYLSYDVYKKRSFLWFEWWSLDATFLYIQDAKDYIKAKKSKNLSRIVFEV